MRNAGVVVSDLTNREESPRFERWPAGWGWGPPVQRYYYAAGDYDPRVLVGDPEPTAWVTGHWMT